MSTSALSTRFLPANSLKATTSQKPTNPIQGLTPVRGLKEVGVGHHHTGEHQLQPYLAQPEGALVGAELPIGELHVQQPVVQVGRGQPLVVEEELSLPHLVLLKLFPYLPGADQCA
jgi:hypothetical protein